MRAVAMVAMLALSSTVGCHREDPTRTLVASTSSATRLPSSTVPAGSPSTPAPSSSTREEPDESPDGAPEWGEIHKPNCSPTLLAQLQAGIAHLYDDPPGPQIEKVEHPVAYAYTALLRWSRGDEAGSNRALHRIPYDVADIARVRLDSREPRIRELLRFVFEAEYRYVGHACRMPGGTGNETWCGIFDKYPEAALAAFRQLGGVVADSYSSDQLHHCAALLLQDRVSLNLAREFGAASSKVIPALYDVALHPIGTTYSAVLTWVGDLLEEPIFGVSRVERPDPNKLKQDVDDADRYSRDLDARLARFGQQEAHIAPAIASAYCKMAEHRGESVSADSCQANAVARLESALQMWLEARPYAEVRIEKGQPYEPKPWR